MKSLAIVAATCALLAPHSSQAASHFLLESRADAPSGAEVLSVDFATQADLLANNFSNATFLPTGISPSFSIADMASQNGAYHLLLESNADAAGGLELLMVDYASYADLKSDTNAGTTFLPMDIAEGFSVRGFTYGDDAYHLLLESDTDAAGGAELRLFSYNSFADLKVNNVSSSLFLQTDIASTLSVAGLGYDGGAYRLLLESDVDVGSGPQLFLLSYNSLGDFKTNSSGSTALLPAYIGATLSVRAFEYDSVRNGGGGDIGAIPEPAVWAMMLLGFGAIGALQRRRKVVLAR